MIELHAWRYDGHSSARVAVKLNFTSDLLLIQKGNELLRYTYKDVTLLPRVANTLIQLDFADGSQCELEDQPLLDQALARLRSSNFLKLIHKIENHWPSILLVIVLAVAVMFGLIQYAIPVMARQVAMAIPVEAEVTMGQEAMDVFESFMKPSELTETRQNELRAQFLSLAKSASITPREILFRKGEAIGANAFALPSGIIVFTDEIVNLAQDDRELLGVFVHELGHVKYRHTMQQLLQNTTTGLLIIVLTGDISSATSLAATLPTILVQTKFSRDFEREADDYAIELFINQGIDPKYLGQLLQRMEEKAGGNGMPGFLSTHPQTSERIGRLNGDNKHR